jgi:hypothetical protein
MSESDVILYRIEDAGGRGPFQPGFSHEWRDAAGPDLPPPWVEAGITISQFRRLFSYHAMRKGIACRSREQLHQWFSRTERRRLKRFGFREVEIRNPRILLETETQVVFEVLPTWRAGCDVGIGEAA